MSKILKIFLLIPLFFLLIVFLPGFGCRRNPKKTAGPKITLNFWSVFNDSDYFAPIIQAYQAKNPKVRIVFKKFTIEEYEKELLESFAEGRGPDIFSVSDSWMPRYLNKLYPAPEDMLSLENFKEVFVDAADEALIDNDRIYGLPLSLDTLGLYYNVDLFNSQGIVNPPKTWEEFLRDVEKLTVLDEEGRIVLAGAALGTAKNVNRAADILNVIMLQSGEPMSVDKAPPMFGDGASDALKFYTDFANPRKRAYTWNLSQDYSIDKFTAGEAAMMINYSYHRPTIKRKAPNLRFKTAPLPQLDPAHKINYTIFWAEGVSVTSPYPEEAWKFLIYLASQDSARQYLQASGKISPRRDLIEEQEKDSLIKDFAHQALTARTWYQAGNPERIEEIMNQMIDSVVLKKKTVKQALQDAQEEIANVFSKAKK